MTRCMNVVAEDWGGRAVVRHSSDTMREWYLNSESDLDVTVPDFVPLIDDAHCGE